MNKQPCILERIEGSELNHNPACQSSPALLGRSDTASQKSEVLDYEGRKGMNIIFLKLLLFLFLLAELDWSKFYNLRE